MKAAILNAPNEIEFLERDVPEIKEDEVLVKIAYGGICGSDVHGYTGDQPFITYPRVMGHEISGVIEESRSDKFKNGDKVVIDPVFNCGHCYACKNGRPNVCKNMNVFGIHIDGGFQEYVKLPPKNVHKVDPSIDLKMAALAEPLSIGFEANYRADVGEDDTVTVLGVGTIGTMITLVAKSKGAKVIAVDVNKSSLELAKTLGADHIINAKDEDVAQKIDEYTGGEGSPVVIEATGVKQIIQDTLHYVSPAGRVVILTLVDKDLPISIAELIKKEVDFLGSRLSNNFIPSAIEFIENNDKISLLEDHIKVHPFTDIEQILSSKHESTSNIIKRMVKINKEL